MPDVKPKILIIEDDRELALSHRDNLADIYDVELAFDPPGGILAAGVFLPDMIILDLGFPSDISVGLGLIPALLETTPRAKIIVTTGFGDVEVGARSIEAGAYNYIEKPIRDYHGFMVIIDQALKIAKLEKELKRLTAHPARETSFFDLIGTSNAMQKVYDDIRRAAPTTANILIQGETGTGKELVARAICGLSSRAEAPFIIVNCAAIPETMLEDKLFGHERGAFTGALSKHLGAFELADRGTVFLDEIGEIEPALQAKLLRFIQHKNFQRLGGNKDICVDVRIIAATNKDLANAVKSGRFRDDLYYRLNVYPIFVAPLRSRREDIPLLASHFLREFGRQFGKDVIHIHPSAMVLLMDHGWQGNVRELENLLQRAILCADGNTIRPAHLKGLGLNYEQATLEQLCEKYCEIWVREAYARNYGDSEKTCRDLGMSKRQLQRYDRKFKIDRRIYEKERR